MVTVGRERDGTGLLDNKSEGGTNLQATGRPNGEAEPTGGGRRPSQRAGGPEPRQRGERNRSQESERSGSDQTARLREHGKRSTQTPREAQAAGRGATERKRRGTLDGNRTQHDRRRATATAPGDQPGAHYEEDTMTASTWKRCRWCESEYKVTAENAAVSEQGFCSTTCREEYADRPRESTQGIKREWEPTWTPYRRR